VTKCNHHFDLVVIGAGSGGLVAARFAAQLGARVALAERNRIGGDCTWTGCVPSKALLKAAKVAHEVRTASHYGVIANAPGVNMVQVRDYVRGAIQAVYRFETPEQLQGEGIDVILGAAQFVDATKIQIGDLIVHSKRFLVTTGARPLIPPIVGLQDVPYVTYENIFDNDVLPDTMIVVGGGPVGMEMAQAYKRLGAQVTVVADRILPKEDADVQQLMRNLFEREGIRFVLEQAKSARKNGSSIVIATEHHEAQGDLLLIAAGRRPTVDSLNLERAGVQYSARGIPVDDKLRTNIKHIYAAGDVAGGYQFTHYAAWQAFQAVRNALLPGNSSGVTDLVPWVTFTDPEVAHVGLSEQQASTQFGSRIRIHRWNMDHVDRAVCENDTSGLLKIITKKDATIVGATLVAARAGETIVELIIAMKKKMKIDELAGAIHPYPTYSTAVQQTSADMTVEKLLSGTSGRIVRGLSKITR
jgi:pyruvate/2-oxoglutarate dehydrogenase complex dihydrolipoamide dehydrogenase (E3) component